MPFDPAIYDRVGAVNLGQGLSGILDQQRARELQRLQEKNTLAQLMQQQELGALNINKLKREEAAIPQQQAHARSKELNMWLSSAVQSGRPQEEVLPEAIAKGAEIGVAPEVTTRHVQSVYQSAQTPQQRSDFAFSQAYPDLVAKQRAEAMFAKEKSVLNKGERGQIIFDSQGNAFNVNPYTNEVRPVVLDGAQIQGAQYSPSLQGRISGAKATGSEVGKAQGEAITSLQDIESQMPNLEKLTNDLSELGKKATYTTAGQARDILTREAGFKVGEGAVARKEYISKVDNEILPLLRQTFGAAFTLKEGESLRATLGDPNVSPEEKDAVLRSFIQTKRAQIVTLKRRTGETVQPANNQDAEAVAWALANPNDPRAAQILKLHGM